MFQDLKVIDFHAHFPIKGDVSHGGSRRTREPRPNAGGEEREAAVLGSLEVDRERLARRARGGFMTSTELADVLVREHRLSFRLAHRVMTGAVKRAIDEEGDSDAGNVTPGQVEDSARAVLGRSLELDPGTVQLALDPWEFVRRRKLAGGPAPDAVSASLSRSEDALRHARVWLSEEVQRLENVTGERQHRASVLQQAGVSQ